MNEMEYKEMFAKVQSGQISEKEWFDYCFEVLGNVVEENKDVFVRLKNR
jgi:hypothetical protein